MTINKEIKRLSNFIEIELNMKLPNIFIKDEKPSDLTKFIDIEALFLRSFSFPIEKLNELGINSLYKIDKNWFQQLDLSALFKDGHSNEERDIGMGYANKSSNGKGPTLKEAREIKEMLYNASTTKHNYLFQTAKSAGLLVGIGSDKLTDFYLRIKKEEMKEATRLIVEFSRDKLGISYSVDKLIDQMILNYKEHSDDEAFPYFTPLQITEGTWEILNSEFKNAILEEILHDEKININYPKDVMKSYTKKNEYLISMYKELVQSEESKQKISNSIHNEIKRIDEIMKSVNNINDLKVFKRSWEIDYVLKDYLMLEKLNLIREIVLYQNEEGLELLNICVDLALGRMLIIKNHIHSNKEFITLLSGVKCKIDEKIQKYETKYNFKIRKFILHNINSKPIHADGYISMNNKEEW